MPLGLFSLICVLVYQETLQAFNFHLFTCLISGFITICHLVLTNRVCGSKGRLRITGVDCTIWTESKKLPKSWFVHDSKVFWHQINLHGNFGWLILFCFIYGNETRLTLHLSRCGQKWQFGILLNVHVLKQCKLQRSSGAALLSSKRYRPVSQLLTEYLYNILLCRVVVWPQTFCYEFQVWIKMRFDHFYSLGLNYYAMWMQWCLKAT